MNYKSFSNTEWLSYIASSFIITRNISHVHTGLTRNLRRRYLFIHSSSNRQASARGLSSINKQYIVRSKTVYKKPMPVNKLDNWLAKAWDAPQNCTDSGFQNHNTGRLFFFRKGGASKKIKSKHVSSRRQRHREILATHLCISVKIGARLRAGRIACNMLCQQ